MKLNLFIFFSNKEDITEEKLSQARIFVVAGSREKFTAAEVGKFQKFILNGMECTVTGIWTEHNADESKLEYCFVTFVFNAVLLFRSQFTV